MADFEREREPLWRTSAGRLREETPVSRKEGQPHLTGYQAGRQDREARKPREVGRLGSSYGDVAVGVSRNKNMTVSVSRRRNLRGPAVREEEKTLRSDGSVRINLARADFRTNPSDKKKSAVAYHSGERRAPDYLMDRFRELSATHHQETLGTRAPFLDREKDELELKSLRRTADQLRAEGAPLKQRDAVERQKERVQQRLSEQKVTERRVWLMLRKAKEESERMAGEFRDPLRLFTGGAVEEVPSGEEGETPPDEEENKEKSEKN